jgi:diguanylate cyclase (GGDEF)-like protein
MTPLTAPAVVPPSPAPDSAERWMTELSALLRELEAVATAGHALPPVFSETVDEQLVHIRLGLAASLFAALQCRNAAAAGHSLRVALACSAWAMKMQLLEAEREAIEVAALLHDIGLVAAPDHVLLKPSSLDADEADAIAHARQMGHKILRGGCASKKVLEIVENVPAWFDGSRGDYPLHGQQLPLGARMIAIAEAFDSMTTDHVYRPAMSQERAMAELFDCAGTQFDPELVRSFMEYRQSDTAANHWEVARRWLRSLDPAMVNSYWELNCVPSPETEPGIDALFQGRLLDNMYDAVVFIDASCRIVLWNRGAERLTGINAVGMRGQVWSPALLEMADEKGNAIGEADCPLRTAIRCGAQSLRRLTIIGRGERRMAVDVHSIPVIDRKGATHGAVLLFHDASSEISLERQCQNLHEKATKDSLTQVANRAEFDRVLATFVAAHQQHHAPCSLMMCDLDHFKRVNDTYGHQAGDEVILSLVGQLKSSCRPGDLVARYGGEEFVVLCADCDNATAARRAEHIRKQFCQIPQPKMDGRTASVSIGVTEIQPGDTPETMLRRADRALLTAKANGRNTVVQLGAGGTDEMPPLKPSSGFFRAARQKEILNQDLITPVPVKVAVEKLRGFVADHRAKIVAIDGNRVRLEICRHTDNLVRRLTERQTAFVVELQFEEERPISAAGETTKPLAAATARTRIKISIAPRTNRDRRSSEISQRARELLTSFRSYLMAAEEASLAPTGPLRRIKRILAPWLARK